MRPGRDARLGAWLFALVASAYLLTLPGRITTPDGVLMFRLTESLAERGELSVAAIAQTPEFGGQSVRDPATGAVRFYSWFAPGMSFANVPVYLLGRALVGHSSAAEQGVFARDVRPRVFAAGPAWLSPRPRARLVMAESWYSADALHFRVGFLSWVSLWTSALLCAGCVAGVFALTRSLGYSVRVALGQSLLVAFATPLFPYARQFFSEPLSAFGLMWFAVFARRGRDDPSRRAFAWTLAGLSLGLAVLAKAAHLVLLAPAGAMLLASSRGQPRRDVLRALVGFSLAVGLCVGVLMTFNALRFGSVFVTGYGDNLSRWSTPPREGLLGLLVSPGRGLITYCPVVLLAALSWRRFFRRGAPELLFGLGALTLLLAVFCRWFMWEGGWCFGPRYLVPVVPLLCLPIAEFWEISAEKTRWSAAARAVGCLLVACSLVATLSGVVVDVEVFHNWIHLDRVAALATWRALHMPRFYDLVRWDWRHAALLNAWPLGASESFLVVRAIRSPGLVLGCFAGFAAALALSVRGIVREVRHGG